MQELLQNIRDQNIDFNPDKLTKSLEENWRAHGPKGTSGNSRSIIADGQLEVFSILLSSVLKYSPDMYTKLLDNVYPMLDGLEKSFSSAGLSLTAAESVQRSEKIAAKVQILSVVATLLTKGPVQRSAAALSAEQTQYQAVAKGMLAAELFGYRPIRKLTDNPRFLQDLNLENENSLVAEVYDSAMKFLAKQATKNPFTKEDAQRTFKILDIIQDDLYELEESYNSSKHPNSNKNAVFKEEIFYKWDLFKSFLVDDGWKVASTEFGNFEGEPERRKLVFNEILTAYKNFTTNSFGIENKEILLFPKDPVSKASAKVANDSPVTPHEAAQVSDPALGPSKASKASDPIFGSRTQKSFFWTASIASQLASVALVALEILLLMAPLLLVPMPFWAIPALLMAALSFPALILTKGVKNYFINREIDGYSAVAAGAAFLAIASVALTTFFSALLPVSVLLSAAVILSVASVAIMQRKAVRFTQILKNFEEFATKEEPLSEGELKKVAPLILETSKLGPQQELASKDSTGKMIGDLGGTDELLSKKDELLMSEEEEQQMLEQLRKQDQDDLRGDPANLRDRSEDYDESDDESGDYYDDSQHTVGSSRKN